MGRGEFWAAQLAADSAAAKTVTLGTGGRWVGDVVAGTAGQGRGGGKRTDELAAGAGSCWIIGDFGVAGDC
jgi:hypothetical protein